MNRGRWCLARRGTGVTHRQLERMGHNGIFIWCNTNLMYVWSLCAKIGGKVSPTRGLWDRGEGGLVYIRNSDTLNRMGWVERLYGFHFYSLSVDHAFRWSDESSRNLIRLGNCVRAHDKISGLHSVSLPGWLAQLDLGWNA